MIQIQNTNSKRNRAQRACLNSQSESTLQTIFKNLILSFPTYPIFICSCTLPTSTYSYNLFDLNCKDPLQIRELARHLVDLTL